MKRRVSILFAAVCMAASVWAKTQVEVFTSPEQVVFGRGFDVTYVVEGRGRHITLKQNDQFDIVAGPYCRTQNYTAREKGRLVARTRTLYTFTMVPRESGEVKLPKASIELSKGKTSSKAHKINVLEPRHRMNPWGNMWGDDMFGDMWQREPRPRHELHFETITPEQIDTTGCELTVCAPDSAREGEKFCISYAIAAEADSIELKDTADFEIVGGPGYGTSWQSIWENGKQQNRYEKKFTYVVKARKAGVLNLPKARVWVGETCKESDKKTISIQTSEK